MVTNLTTCRSKNKERVQRARRKVVQALRAMKTSLSCLKKEFVTTKRHADRTNCNLETVLKREAFRIVNVEAEVVEDEEVPPEGLHVVEEEEAGAVAPSKGKSNEI